MALESTFQPRSFEFEIQQGAHFHLEFPPFLDVATGDPFDFTAEAWGARMDVLARTTDGGSETVCSFAVTGENGKVTLRADGTVAFDLADEYTTALDPTTAVQWSSAKTAVYGDLVLTDPVDGEHWAWFRGIGSIRKQVTGG